VPLLEQISIGKSGRACTKACDTVGAKAITHANHKAKHTAQGRRKMA
jgi:hypothetical protein